MTQKEAKELTIEVWTYLAEHPECAYKCQIPDNLYERIHIYTNDCPLCELGMTIWHRGCNECPLHKAGEGCGSASSAWHKWIKSDPADTATRKDAAELIVKIVSAWEPEDNN
jgi:hypothetical protein